MVVHRDDLLRVAHFDARIARAQVRAESRLVSEQTNTNGRLSGGR
jgi:hypothetical protein